MAKTHAAKKAHTAVWMSLIALRAPTGGPPGRNLLRTDCSSRGPVRISDSLQVHLEEANRFLAGRDPIPDFLPGPILDGGRVPDRGGTGGNLPDVAVGGRCEVEVAHVPQCVGVHGESVGIGAV